MTPPLPFTHNDLMAAVVWWISEGENNPKGILARLHLPGTRRRVLNHLRDLQLIAAAELIHPGGAHYAKAVALRHACHHFGRRQWPSWWLLPAPPEQATKLEQVLFWAFKFDDGNIRENRPHTPADWSLSAFRKLLPIPQNECREAA